jgi:ribosomal protein S18 acetylase RimI-like enzyme
MNVPASTKALAIAPIADNDVADVIALWRRAGLVREWNDPAGDIALARRDGNATVLLGRMDGAAAASVLVGHDGHRGWVYYVSVDPDHRNKGFGRLIMQAAEDWLRARGIQKLQLMVRGDNAQVHAFYEQIGYYDQQRTTFAKWLDGRAPTP